MMECIKTQWNASNRSEGVACSQPGAETLYLPTITMLAEQTSFVNKGWNRKVWKIGHSNTQVRKAMRPDQKIWYAANSVQPARTYFRLQSASPLSGSQTLLHPEGQQSIVVTILRLAKQCAFPILNLCISVFLNFYISIFEYFLFCIPFVAVSFVSADQIPVA